MPIPRPCRVLVVDDHPDSADTLARVLRLQGHDARAIVDPHQAADTVEHYAPHVVLLDIGMPGLDGWTVAKLLREKHPFGTLKLVALTAYAMPEDHERSRQAGFDAHVAKPVDPELLKSILEQCFADTVRLPSKPGSTSFR